MAEAAGPNRRALEICDQALSRDPGELKQYLDSASGDNTRLRASVETNLRAMDDVDSFMDEGLVDDSDRIGTQVDGFELTSLIGTGGMGDISGQMRRCRI